jgi:hypothetical protein
MGSESEQDPDKTCQLRESVLRAFNMSGYRGSNLIFPNVDVTWVSWKYTEDNVAGGKIVNLVVAPYVTTQARRLKIYESLSKFGESI